MPDPILAHLALILTTLIVLGYTASLWWLLRAESATTLLMLLSVCLVALSLRLVNTTEYPPGLNEDEPKKLHCVGVAPLNAPSTLFGEGCTGVPSLLTALFEAQLVPVVGPNRWAMRSYSIAASVLSVAAAFAVGRALQLRVGSSLAAAALMGVLPWSLFFGRVELGGELVFHQLLLLAALGLLIEGRGGWPAVGIGAFNLCLLFYDYFSGRPLLGLIPVAAVLAKGWRARLLCLAIPCLALLGWAPHLMQHPRWAGVGLSTTEFSADVMVNPIQNFLSRALFVLTALARPSASDGCLTTRASGVHPYLVLGLAAIGSLTGIRRGLFLWSGFLVCLLPAILGWGPQASTHRMLNAFPFIVLAAACAFDLIRWRALRIAVTCGAVAVIAVQSVQLYFSPQSWPAESRAGFNWELEELVDALPLPPHPRLIVSSKMDVLFAPHVLVDSNYEFLAVENWFPQDGAPTIYAFGGKGSVELQPFYQALFGRRVKAFGGAFLVTLEGSDWSWLRRHGWAYEARCDDVTKQEQVPTLFQTGLTFASMPRFCVTPATHTWRGRWSGPRANLRLHFTGKAVLEIGDRSIEKEGSEATLDFTVNPDTDVTVTLTFPAPDPGPAVALFEVTPTGERIPAWEFVTPVFADDDARPCEPGSQRTE